MSKGKPIKNYQDTEKKAEYAYKFYVNKGYTPEQASGIVGNLRRESNFNTSIVGTADDKGSQGVAQWHSGRLDKLKSMYGDKWTDLDSQLEFIDWELNNTEKSAGKALKNAKTVWEAGQVFSDVYERPKVKFQQDRKRQQFVTSSYNTHGKMTLTDQDKQMFSNQQITTPLIDFEVPQINRSFASVLDSPKEETKKEEKPSEALNQLKEQEFVKQYKSLFTQPQVVQQEQEVNQPIQTADLQGIFNQVSQFVDGDVAQQGGKKPIYVTDKNDPRYKAYNDSLNSFEKSESFKKDIIKYVGKNISKSQQEEMINLAMNYQREKYDYDKGWNRKIEPIDKTVIHLTKTFKNGAEGNIDLENYKKPQQPIILEETRPKVQGLNTNITPAGIQSQQELPQGTEIPQRTYAQIPTSYDVSSQRYNMQGENPYYNFNAEKADYETALRAKLSAENYNADIERRYGNEEALKNPKAVERLNQLRQEVKITPNYQNGGEIVKDNNGYWNPNNWGKTVQIDGGDITMKGVNQILEGYSPETGERKLMFPNFDYKFSGAKRVIETPIKDNEIEFLKNIKK